jgi:hypothetical protein
MPSYGRASFALRITCFFHKAKRKAEKRNGDVNTTYTKVERLDAVAAALEETAVEAAAARIRRGEEEGGVAVPGAHEGAAFGLVGGPLAKACQAAQVGVVLLRPETAELAGVQEVPRRHGHLGDRRSGGGADEGAEGEEHGLRDHDGLLALLVVLA